MGRSKTAPGTSLAHPTPIPGGACPGDPAGACAPAGTAPAAAHAGSSAPGLVTEGVGDRARPCWSADEAAGSRSVQEAGVVCELSAVQPPPPACKHSLLVLAGELAGSCSAPAGWGCNTQGQGCPGLCMTGAGDVPRAPVLAPVSVPMAGCRALARSSKGGAASRKLKEAYGEKGVHKGLSMVVVRHGRRMTGVGCNMQIV